MKSGLIARKQARLRATRLLTSIGYEFPVNLPVGSLAPVQKAGVAIGRAIQDWESGGARVLVLDEPTSAMPNTEASKLFGVMERVRSQGLGVLFVTHHLDEVFEVADSVTVFRDGVSIATVPVQSLDHEALVELMLGHSKPERAIVVRSDELDHPMVATQSTLLRLEAVSAGPNVGIDLHVGSGEIVGLAGVTGSGRDELIEAIAGHMTRTGDMFVEGRAIPQHRPHIARRAGIGYVPADRARNSVFPTFDVGSNITASGLRPHRRNSLLSLSSEAEEVEALMEQLDVLPRNRRANMMTLSGGNQQKAVVGRFIRRDPKILLLIEPTQGVDVGARGAIYSAIRSTAARGGCVLMSSSDADELAEICTRVVVLRRGSIVADLKDVILLGDVIEDLALGIS